MFLAIVNASGQKRNKWEAKATVEWSFLKLRYLRL